MNEFALTLIGTPTREPLSATHVELVCTDLQLTCTPDWLAENEACDLVLSSEKSAAEISALAEVALDGAAIDAICTPLNGRRKALLISDMDSTIVDQECIDELGRAMGLGDAIGKITQDVVNGKIGFSDALRQRLTLMKGMQRDVLQQVYCDRITLKSGARTLVQTMRQNGAYCILVSGGFSYFTSRVAKSVGFHDHQANELKFEHDQLTGTVVEPVLGRSAKLETLNRLCAERGLSVQDVLAVGDGANDIKMIKAAGLGIAFHGSRALKDEANGCVDHADLTALLFAQGYRKSEFRPG